MLSSAIAQEQPKPFKIVTSRDDIVIGLTAEELRGWLLERTTKFWVPERWTFITEVPKTSVGKLDKKRIRQDIIEWQAGNSAFLSTL